jgi:hypothetical protein
MGNRKSDAKARTALTTPDQIDHSILLIRGHKVLLDAQLAAFYGIETKRLLEAAKRNRDRFPDDFMFRLNADEWEILRSQIVTSNLRSQTATSSSRGHGGRRYPPYAFTEQGVAMLSSVLRSPRAIDVNIQIMRAFVRLRQLLSEHKELADRLTKLEQQMRNRDESVDRQFREVFSLLDRLFSPAAPSRRPIGFHAGDR